MGWYHICHHYRYQISKLTRAAGIEIEIKSKCDLSKGPGREKGYENK